MKGRKREMEWVYGGVYGVMKNGKLVVDNVDKVKGKRKSDKEVEKLEEYEGEG